MKIAKITGLVINKNDYGEADRIITVFTKEKGKISMILKGIRKSKKRDKYASDILVISDFVIYERENINIVSKLELKESFLELKKDLFKINIAIYILKIINLIFMENEHSQKIYILTEKALIYIEKTEDKIKILILILYYITTLIKNEGLEVKIYEKGFNFNLEYGKIEEDQKKFSIKLKKIEKIIIYLIYKKKIDLILTLNPSKETLLNIINYFEKYMEFQLEIKIRINDFLEEEK